MLLPFRLVHQYSADVHGHGPILSLHAFDNAFEASTMQSRSF